MKKYYITYWYAYHPNGESYTKFGVSSYTCTFEELPNTEETIIMLKGLIVDMVMANEPIEECHIEIINWKILNE